MRWARCNARHLKRASRKAATRLRSDLIGIARAVNKQVGGIAFVGVALEGIALEGIALNKGLERTVPWGG